MNFNSAVVSFRQAAASALQGDQAKSLEMIANGLIRLAQALEQMERKMK